jgi:hypothetical protein
MHKLPYTDKELRGDAICCLRIRKYFLRIRIRVFLILNIDPGGQLMSDPWSYMDIFMVIKK